MKIDRDTSFGSSEEDEDYNWEKFIHEEQGIPAPAEAFCQPTYAPVNNFRKGHIVMAKDPKIHIDGGFVAEVEKVYKCFIRLRLMELGRCRFWTTCDSDLVFPFYETQLRRHPDNPKTDKAWEKWLTKCLEQYSNQIAPATIVEPLKPYFYPARNLFQKGMVLAYMDTTTFTGKFSPAIVTDVKNYDWISLRLADRESRTDVTVRFDDRRLFSIKFTKEAGIPVRSLKMRRGIKTPKIFGPSKVAKEKKEIKPKKKLGRPKGSKSKKPTKAQQKITTPSYSNSDCPIDVTCDFSFHPQRASTPVEMDTTYYNTSFNNSMPSYNDTESKIDYNMPLNTTPVGNLFMAENSKPILTVAASTPFTEKKYNPAVFNMSKSVYEQPLSISAQNLETNRAALENLNISPQLPSSMSFSQFEMSSFPTALEKLVMNFPNLEESLLQAMSSSSGRSTDARTRPIASALRNCYFDQTCTAILNNNAFAGPYIKPEVLTAEINGLPILNYRMQYYNIVVALAKSTAAPVAILDIMCRDSVIEPANIIVYVESGDVIHSKKVPSPTNFDNASEWLKYFLKRLHADEDLVTLQQVG